MFHFMFHDKKAKHHQNVTSYQAIIMNLKTVSYALHKLIATALLPPSLFLDFSDSVFSTSEKRCWSSQQLM